LRHLNSGGFLAVINKNGKWTLILMNQPMNENELKGFNEKSLFFFESTTIVTEETLALGTVVKIQHASS
jgi:hypothetical protein